MYCFLAATVGNIGCFKFLYCFEFRGRGDGGGIPDL